MKRVPSSAMRVASVRHAVVCVITALSLGCLAIPTGTRRVESDLAPNKPTRPVVVLGATSVLGNPERQSEVMAALSSVVQKSRAGPNTVDDTGLSESEEVAFSTFTPGDPASYAAVSSNLPPHYLVEMQLQFDASDLPTDQELAAVGFLHGYFLLTLSWIPMHSMKLKETCSGNVYAVEGGSRRHLGDISFHGERGGVGTFYWAAAHERFTDEAVSELVADCRNTIRAEGLKRIADLESAKSPLVHFASWHSPQISPRLDSPETSEGAPPGGAAPTDRIAAWVRSVVTVQAGSAVGSGVVVDASGVVLTNAHVVGNETWVAVQLSDGRKVPGKILGIDAKRDLALLKIAADDQPPLPIATNAPSVGSEVIAIGAPLGLSQTVTKGIVSAYREVNGVKLLQTDAAVNYGNSGGPLISVDGGQLVGINTLILRKDDAEGLNFAVGSEEIKKAFGSLF